MAKQSFSVGQVLTAAQMQSLQQTAMGGGSPSVKTASYTLVAADAGTVIQVNSTSATTITVNTGLFAAGDSIQIQNIGSGTTTITAGTATVNSAGSLGVTQYDGGFLYFSSASSAIWFDYTQAGTTLPLTTKGDLFGYSTTNARVPIGTNGQILTADSTEALGLKWATPGGAGANWTLLNSGGTSLSGSSTTISGISGADKIFILVEAASTDSSYATLYLRLNGDSGSNYNAMGGAFYGSSSWSPNVFDPYDYTDTGFRIGTQGSSNTGASYGWALITGCNSSGVKMANIAAGVSTGGGDQTRGVNHGGVYNSSSTISSVTYRTSGGNLDNGKIYVYTSA